MEILGIWLFSLTVFVSLFGRTAIALWREPVFCRPILVFESDDWGPGPNEHAEALRRLLSVLSSCKDWRGHSAVMTIGVILAIPDGARIRAEGFQAYRSLPLSDARFCRIVEILQLGHAGGTFRLQLHGMEHFYPPALWDTRDDTQIAHWLSKDLPYDTEQLPSALQSRWAEVPKLLSEKQVEELAKAEIDAFANTFGWVPQAVVPPTFVWQDALEKAWANNGVKIVVTPGRQYTGRTADGGLVASGKQMLNGQQAQAGAIYWVRDNYFEPALGHRAEVAIEQMAQKSRLGRPVLFETHRFNFVGADSEGAFSELEKLLQQALVQFPNLTFLAPEALVDAMVNRDPTLIEPSLGKRCVVWLSRLKQVPKLFKTALLAGFAIPATLSVLVYTLA